MIDQQLFQFVVFGVNGIFTVFVLFLSMYLGRVNRSLEQIQEQAHNLNNKVLEHYVTRAELEIVRKYIRDLGHDIRNDLSWVTSCLYLIAQKNEMMQQLPNRPHRGD